MGCPAACDKAALRHSSTDAGKSAREGRGRGRDNGRGRGRGGRGQAKGKGGKKPVADANNAKPKKVLKKK